MLRTILKKCTALLLLVVVLMATTLSLCGESHAGDGGAAACHHGSAGSDAGDRSDADHPGAGDHGDGSSHDAASCYCSCHLPVTEQASLVRYCPVVSEIPAAETVAFLPEVFLSRFIPPQLAA